MEDSRCCAAGESLTVEMETKCGEEFCFLVKDKVGKGMELVLVKE